MNDCQDERAMLLQEERKAQNDMKRFHNEVPIIYTLKISFESCELHFLG
jgi:hypothetical protein